MSQHAADARWHALNLARRLWDGELVEVLELLDERPTMQHAFDVYANQAARPRQPLLRRLAATSVDVLAWALWWTFAERTLMDDERLIALYLPHGERFAADWPGHRRWWESFSAHADFKVGDVGETITARTPVATLTIDRTSAGRWVCRFEMPKAGLSWGCLPEETSSRFAAFVLDWLDVERDWRLITEHATHPKGEHHA